MDQVMKSMKDMPGPDYYYLRDSDITAFSSSIQENRYVTYVNSKKKKFGVPWISPTYGEVSLPNIETSVGTDQEA